MRLLYAHCNDPGYDTNRDNDDHLYCLHNERKKPNATPRSKFKSQLTSGGQATTTIYGPVQVTSTTTISKVTTTTTINAQATATGFAMYVRLNGEVRYASNVGDSASFNTDHSGASVYVLGSNGELSQPSGYFADGGSWQYQENSPDFVRFENQTRTNYPMNPVTCQLDTPGRFGQCTLNCVNSAMGWNQNCIYEVNGDGRNGGWIIAPNGIRFCEYISTLR